MNEFSHFRRAPVAFIIEIWKRKFYMYFFFIEIIAFLREFVITDAQLKLQ